MRPQTFVFFGKSGSGKGTQAKILGEYLKKTKGNEVLYIETGEGFRQFMETGSHTANLTKQVLTDGGLMPVFMPIWLWTDFLVKNYNGTQDLILDGLCRRPAEAPVLDSALKFFGQNNPIIIYINVSNNWAFDRMKARGRRDDTDAYIKSRLEWFEWNVVPSMAYFHEHPDYVFLEINGEQSVEDVHNELISRLATR